MIESRIFWVFFLLWKVISLKMFFCFSSSTPRRPRWTVHRTDRCSRHKRRHVSRHLRPQWPGNSHRAWLRSFGKQFHHKDRHHELWNPWSNNLSFYPEQRTQRNHAHLSFRSEAPVSALHAEPHDSAQSGVSVRYYSSPHGNLIFSFFFLNKSLSIFVVLNVNCWVRFIHPTHYLLSQDNDPLMSQSPWRNKLSCSEGETLGGFPVKFLVQVVSRSSEIKLEIFFSKLNLF